MRDRSNKLPPSRWEVVFHDEFDPEFDALDQDVQNELLACALAVERLGPAADRPHVGVLNNDKHSNMKELRFTANNGTEVWRAAFAFDPKRKAIVLVAAGPRLQSIDLNPVLAMPEGQGAYAVDAVIEVAE